MTKPVEWAFIALGSNLGDRDAHLAVARQSLAELRDTDLVAVSTVEETTPLGSVPQGPYLNQMALIRTALSPRELLESCLEIERRAGRVRGERWGPRTLDLDIVRYGAREVNDPELRVPHPELAHRAFWQRELAELESHVR